MERINRARLVSYDPATHTAAVELKDALGTLLTVPVMADVGGHLLTPGVDVALLTWADVGAVLLGPYGTVPPDDLQVSGEYLYIYDAGTYLRRRVDQSEAQLVTDRDTLSLLPGAARLRVQGNIIRYTESLNRHYASRPRVLTPPDNAYFDLVTFSCPGTQTSGNHRGLCSGLLVLSLNNRESVSPPQQLWSSLYFVSVFACYTANLTAQVQPLGTPQTYAAQAITANLRAKAGATRQALTLEALFTHANWPAAGATAIYYLDMHSHATNANSYITPELTP